jgi:hypothetical protein
MTDAKNRKLRQALAQRWQDQPRKPDYSRPVTGELEHGLAEPYAVKSFLLSEAIDNAPEDAS